MVTIFFAAIFLILWGVLGGLRSSFGKAILVFSAVVCLVIGAAVLYGVHLDKATPSFAANQSTISSCPAGEYPLYNTTADMEAGVNAVWCSPDKSPNAQPLSQ